MGKGGVGVNRARCQLFEVECEDGAVVVVRLRGRVCMPQVELGDVLPFAVRWRRGPGHEWELVERDEGDC